LDNQSTVDIFCNTSLLQNIWKSDNTMKIQCNAGSRTTNLIEDLSNYGTVWYDPGGIANILSMKRVKEKCHVHYDSKGDGIFYVIKPAGITRKFVESNCGLYYLDTAEDNEFTLVTTVTNKADQYTRKEYVRAEKARELQITIGCPSTKDLLNIINNNLLNNCPVNRADVIAANNIFGADLGSLKGKTTREKVSPVNLVRNYLPKEIMNRHRSVTLCIDIMFVNQIPMLVSVSCNIKFGTIQDIPNRSNKHLLSGI
jgi:hypothetical protein